MISNSTILLTGCAGFIGCQTARQLLQAGNKVVGIDNLNPQGNVRLKRYRLEQLLQNSNFTFEKVDIENTSSISELFLNHGFDAMINLAAQVGIRNSVEHPVEYMSSNTIGLLNLLEAARRNGVNKLVQASTSSIYSGQSIPFSECNPTSHPISPYAVSKHAAESMAQVYHHLHDIDVSILRYFTVYGPAGRPDMAIPRFIQWIDQGIPITLFGDGSQSRDFTFVDDIALGTIEAVKPLGCEVINLGRGQEPIKLDDIIRLIEGLLGKKARVIYQPKLSSDMKSTWANIDKAKELLGWKPSIAVEQGLESCVRWYKDNLPWSATICPQTAYA